MRGEKQLKEFYHRGHRVKEETLLTTDEHGRTRMGTDMKDFKSGIIALRITNAIGGLFVP
jgi:hypothetical protein